MPESTTLPLNILQIASGFPAWGGTELHILNLSNQLVLRGHDVTVACRPDGWVSNRAKELGLKTLDATVVRQQDWQDYGVIANFCRHNEIDIVHTHWSTDAFVPPVAARAAGVPVRMMTRHSPYPFKTSLGTYLFSEVLYNRILAVSQSVATTLMNHGVPATKLTVIHHGTDVDEFENVSLQRLDVREAIGLSNNDIAVGILGRIAEEKGHKYLFDAIKKLKDVASIKIVVVGEGPQLDEQREYVKANAVDDRVLWVPFRKDVNNVINALDIVAVPSIWEEPCSAVIQQAMALSKPVIGTKVGGTPEMILDGKTGLLASPKNADELADAIRTLATNDTLRAQQGIAGAERVRALFTLQKMTTRIEEVYRQELSRSGRTGARKPAPTASAQPA